jgi:hypothetical protein
MHLGMHVAATFLRVLSRGSDLGYSEHGMRCQSGRYGPHPSACTKPAILAGGMMCVEALSVRILQHQSPCHSGVRGIHNACMNMHASRELQGGLGRSKISPYTRISGRAFHGARTTCLKSCDSHGKMGSFSAAPVFLTTKGTRVSVRQPVTAQEMHAQMACSWPRTHALATAAGACVHLLHTQCLLVYMTGTAGSLDKVWANSMACFQSL